MTASHTPAAVGAGRLAHLVELLRPEFRPEDDGPFVPSKTPVRLSIPTYGLEEIAEALDSLLRQRTTMGEKVRRFEREWAAYNRSRHAVMVNSGSSANLIAVEALKLAGERPLRPGDEVITPAVTWATTVFSISGAGCLPVLVDVDPRTFALDPERVEAAITPRTRAIFLVHMMGMPADMPAIMEIARRHDLLVIEDCCESCGAEVAGRKVGGFGDAGTFSFFFSHHITTMEGGIVVTERDDVREMLRATRSHGWIRDLSQRDELARTHAGVDPRFLFVVPGFNLRPTELQGAFGIHQLPKLEPIVEARRSNAVYWREALLGRFGDRLSIPEEWEGERFVWFGMTINVRPESGVDRNELMSFLESKGVETRPLAAGNFAEQPVMSRIPARVAGTLDASRNVGRHSFFFGNHHGITQEAREAVVGYFEEFFSR